MSELYEELKEKVKKKQKLTYGEYLYYREQKEEEEAQNDIHTGAI